MILPGPSDAGRFFAPDLPVSTDLEVSIPGKNKKENMIRNSLLN
jgi:hypothetical protein